MGERMSREGLLVILVLEILIIIGYGMGTKYGDFDTTSGGTNVNDYYGPFQDVHVMVFVGFGFLMTFLKKYGFSAVGFTFFIGAFVLQASILVNSFFHQIIEGVKLHAIPLDITSLIIGDFATASLLISFGALIGKVTPFQVIILSIVHLIFYSINEGILVVSFGVTDIGGSMVIHAFGAYFGLAASIVLTHFRQRALRETNSPLNGSVYHSDIFAMVGTVFLWLFWPSFNGVLADEVQRHRVLINTLFSLCGSCVVAFLASGWLRGRFNMVDIQNATLAGGVAIGSTANFILGPAVAICIGCLAGFVSVAGYIYLQPYLKRKFGVDDTCGVNNLHGMPGIIGGITSCIACAVATPSVYGSEFTTLFAGGDENKQALNQFYSLLITLAMALVSGALGGFVIGFLPKMTQFYSDSVDWDMEDEEKDNATLNSMEMQTSITSDAGMW
eukprot:m.83942 g.83942  ORF g.83942 m.83942 type:complete len:445 (+) comp12139_c0_seq1:157-1491(+)